MRNLIIGVLCLCFCNSSFAGVWVTVAPSNIAYIQVSQPGNAALAPEGLYIGLLSDLTGEAAGYCGYKKNIFIGDQKLADRAYSGLMYAMATQKTVQFWLENKCNGSIDQASATFFKIQAI